MIAGIGHARQLAIELLDVTAQAPSEHAGEETHPLERFRAHAVVVNGDLLNGGGVETVAVLIDRFVELEDVGPAAFDRGIAGAVGADDDVFRHQTVRRGSRQRVRMVACT